MSILFGSWINNDDRARYNMSNTSFIISLSIDLLLHIAAFSLARMRLMRLRRQNIQNEGENHLLTSEEQFFIKLRCITAFMLFHRSLIPLFTIFLKSQISDSNNYDSYDLRRDAYIFDSYILSSTVIDVIFAFILKFGMCSSSRCIQQIILNQPIIQKEDKGCLSVPSQKGLDQDRSLENVSNVSRNSDEPDYDSDQSTSNQSACDGEPSASKVVVQADVLTVMQFGSRSEI